MEHPGDRQHGGETLVKVIHTQRLDLILAEKFGNKKMEGGQYLQLEIDCIDEQVVS